jgi:hypothetical protein
MEHSVISDMILQDAMVLYGQPKWTFGKNTCNTYEVFVSHFRSEENGLPRIILPMMAAAQFVKTNLSLKRTPQAPTT